MPVVKFACPPGKKKYGQAFPVVHCITECDEKCMSPYMMAAIAASNQRNHHKGRYLSATSLTGCARKLRLERTVPYAEYFSQLYYAFRGTITHTVIEEAALVDLGDGKSLIDYGFLSEWRMQIGFCFKHGGFPIPPELDPSDLASLEEIECLICTAEGTPKDQQEVFILGGTLDGAEPLWNGGKVFSWPKVYEYLNNGGDPKKLYAGEWDEFMDEVPPFDPETGVLYCRLHDLKTLMEYAVNYMVKGDPKNTLHAQIKDAYVIQARIYAYLAARSIPPERLRERGVKQLRMASSDIQGFAMGTAPWTGGGPFVWKDNYRNPKKAWPMFPVDLGTEEWVENFIRERARPIYDSLILGKTRGPVCEPEPSSKGSHNWQCDYCVFHGSADCPNPGLEYQLIQEGMDPEEAFQQALANPVEIVDEPIEELNDKDTANLDAFFARFTTGVVATELRSEEEPPAKPKKRRSKKNEVLTN